MRILLTSLMVPGAPSGVRVHYERLAEGLREQGHTVTVVTQASLPRWIRSSIGVVRRGLGLVLGKLGHQIGLELGFVAEIYFAIDRRASYDVVNAQDVSSGYAARLALHDRVPVIVTGHFNDHPGEEVVKKFALREGSVTARFVLRWYNFLLRKTRFFLSISNYALRYASPWLAPDAQYVVVHNGADMVDFAPPATLSGAAAELRQRFAERPIIMNIGQLETRKNQQYLVALAAELRRHTPNFVVALVGHGEDEPLLRQLVAEQSLEDHVAFLGYHSNVIPLLHAADLYLHTATRENCPYVLVEAMAAECPVAALVAGGSPELLAATPELSWPQATTPAEAAARVYELLAAPGALAGLQQRQHAYALDHFSKTAMLTNTMAFFNQARQQMKLPPLDAPRPVASSVGEVQPESEENYARHPAAYSRAQEQV